MWIALQRQTHSGIMIAQATLRLTSNPVRTYEAILDNEDRDVPVDLKKQKLVGGNVL